MAPSAILIRAVEPEDIAAVAEIFAQPRALWGTMQVPFQSIERRRQRHLALPPSHTSLCAVIEGKVIGVGSLHPFDNPRRAGVANLGMAVHDAHAGQGAGRAILRALIDQADKWLNYRRLELTVWADNARAITLYERAGFEREGVMKAYGWRDGQWVDALAMARLRG